MKKLRLIIMRQDVNEKIILSLIKDKVKKATQLEVMLSKTTESEKIDINEVKEIVKEIAILTIALQTLENKNK